VPSWHTTWSQRRLAAAGGAPALTREFSDGSRPKIGVLRLQTMPELEFAMQGVPAGKSDGRRAKTWRLSDDVFANDSSLEVLQSGSQKNA
jgi:hypothetical protein